MDERISKLYEDLKISPANYPCYSNPYDFAKTFKKCSINTEVCISLSGGTEPNKNQNF